VKTARDHVGSFDYGVPTNSLQKFSLTLFTRMCLHS
jgi:hypothetical protein